MGKSTLPSLARPPAKPKPVQKALPVNNRAPRPFSRKENQEYFSKDYKRFLSLSQTPSSSPKFLRSTSLVESL